jgi:hypothetical protein
MRAAACWLLLVGLGCKGDDTGKGSAPVDPEPEDSDPLTVVDPVPEIDGACPDGAAEAGVAGDSVREEVSVTWRWSEERQMSFADPVFRVLPADTEALAVTVDAGSTRTALARLWIDDRVIVDIDEPTEWQAPRPARRSHALAADTWDTWWDTFADTADSWLETAWDSAWDSNDSWDTAAGPPRWGWGVAPFFHKPAVAGTLALPMSPELLAAPGCLSLVPAALDNLDGQTGTVHIVTRRRPAEGARLDVNLIVLEGAGIRPAELQAAGESMRAVYASGGGPELGEVRVFDLPSPEGAFVPFGEPLQRLRSTETPGASELAINLFVIADFARSAGTIGISAGIPGPIGVPGTGGSGVVVTVDGHRKYSGELDTDALGETMAHEAGHQMGLFHTTESSGQSFDILRDTPECDLATFDRDGSGDLGAPECRNAGGKNFMFWIASGWRLEQDEVTPDQAFVLRNTPIVH